MVRSSLVIFLAAALLLAVVPAADAQDWAGRGRAHGSVKDEAGNPIEGARVEVFLRTQGNGPEPVFTNAKGRFTHAGLTGGVWTVLIDAKGYKPSEGSAHVSQFGSNKAMNIVLASDPQSSISTGDELLDAGDYSAARASYTEAMKGLDEVGQARLHSRIGDTYLAEGNLDAAKGEYQQALAYLAPEEQSHVRISLGNAYQAGGDFAAARGEYEKALATLDGEAKAIVLTQIARGYYSEEKFDQAIDNLKMAVEASPGNVQAIQVLADILTRQGREAEAAEYLAQLPEGAKLETDTVLNIGIRLYNDGDTAKALEYFNQAVKDSPDNPEGYYYRGLCNLGSGNNDAAIADFKKLLEIDPDSSHKDEVTEFLSFLEQ
jgi:tetratricopeptide (TPR) repeat protein